MEFGVFMNGYLPGPAAHDPASEHTMLMREAEYAVFADNPAEVVQVFERFPS